MNFPPQISIIPASFCAAFVIGVLAVLVSTSAKFPAETCLYPALLPMIPGIYAYKTFGAFALSVLSESPEAFDLYFSLFTYNGLMTCCIILCLVTGATLPIFLFKKIAFQATR